MALSNKQRRFITEYLQCFNATEAAKRAGYSPRTARAIGSQNLTKVDIATEIKTALQESAMSADEVLNRLAEQARGDYSQYIKMPGYVDLKGLLEDGKGHLIKGIKETKYGLQIEFYDSQTALVTLAKHHGLLTDVLKVKVENELNSALDLLEQNLDRETYERIIAIFAEAGQGTAE